MLLRLVRFAYIGMRPIRHTFAYRPESKLVKNDGARRTMFRIGPVHAQGNGSGVSGTEPERTARYRDLLYARTGVGFHRSHRNRLRTCAYPAGIKRMSRGASRPHGISSGR